MDIGQALAMMRYANQARDYQNQLNAQPNIDWRDIAQPPVEPPVDYGMYGPVAAPVGAPVANYIPEPEPQPFAYNDIVAGYPAPMPVESTGVAPYAYDPTFQELYGAPAIPQPEAQFAYSPTTPSGVMGGAPPVEPATPPVQIYKMPPLPVPGMTARAEMPSEEMPGAEFTARPPQAMMEAPAQQLTGFGGRMAMLEQEQPPVAQTAQPSEEQTPTQAAFKPGQDFKVNLNFGDKSYEAVVKGYIPPGPGEPEPKSVNIVIPQLGNRSMALPTNSPQYQTIFEEYSRLKPLDSTGDEFPALIRVQGIVDPTTGDPAWVPAKIDSEKNRILYKDPDTGATAIYTDKRISDITPEDFQGPITMTGVRDNRELERIQQAKLRPLQPAIEKISNVATGFAGNDQEYEIRNRLKGTLGPGSLENPLGEISWTYDTPVGTLNIEQAVEKGYLPKGFPEQVNSSYSQIQSIANQMAASALEAQTATAPSPAQRDIKIINEQLKFNNERLAAVKSSPNYESSRDLQKQAADIQKAIDELNKKLNAASTTVSTQVIAGGSTVFQATPDVTKYNIDPTDQGGVLALLGGISPLPSPTGAGQQEGTPFTPDDVVTYVRENALSKSQPYAVSDDQQYMSAMAALSNRLQDIESRAVEYAQGAEGLEPEDITNAPNAIFRYTPIGATIPKWETLSVAQAIEEFQESAADFREKAKSGDAVAANAAKQILAEKAQRFTGIIVVPGVGPSYPSPQEETGFNNLMRRFQPVTVADYPLTRTIEVTSGIREAEAPKTTVVPPRSTSGPTSVVQKGVVYPLWYTPGGTSLGKQGYEKADEAFNIFEKMRHNADTYAGAAQAYRESAVGTTTTKNLARIFGDDAGSSLDPRGMAETDNAITQFNQSIIANTADGKALRANMANMLWDLTKASGYPPAVSPGDLATRLENVYIVAQTNPGKIDDAINWVLQGLRGENYIAPAPIKNLLAARTAQNYNISTQDTGAQVVGIINSAKAGNQTAFKEYASKIGGGNVTRLADNVESQWFETALLYAAAGQGKTTYKSGPNTVTWMYNPANPNNNYMRSILTIPASKTGNLDKQLPANKAADGKNITGIGNDVGAEPVYSGVIMRAADILGKADANAFRASFKNQINNISTTSQQIFGGRGANLYTQAQVYRPDDDNNVQWTGSSSNVVKKLFVDTILLGNVLGANRDRKDVYQNGFPKYDRNKAK